MKYIIQEVGKTTSNYARIEADTVIKALELFGGVDEKIKPYERFKTHYFSNIYEIKQEGATSPIYIFHSERSLRKPRSKERGLGKAGTHRVSFSVSCQPEEREAIRKLAEEKGISISELVLSLIK